MANRTHSFSVRSNLSVSRREVWAHASTMAGVNRELFPLVRMTYPERSSLLTAETVTLGKHLFRSWILLFGVLPIDYDDIILEELLPETGFQESSSMFTQRVWRHRRMLKDASFGCVITDEIEFVPRIAVLGVLFRPVFLLAFRLRHWNLRRIFGTAPQP